MDKLNAATKTIIAIYVVTVLFWLGFVGLSHYTATYEGPIFSYLLKPFLIGMMLLPITGGIVGLINSRGWGGWSSAIGRGSLGIGLGTLAWAGGMIIWNYYLFFTDVEVPYPSLADAIFILSWPLWAYGLLQISRVVGIKYALKNKKGKFAFVLIPVMVIALSYYLLFEVARGGEVDFGSGVIKLFFDLFYPIGDIVILTFTILVYNLSRNFLGGIYKRPILFLLLAFLLNYFADFTFSYTTTNETYFNGHLVDLLFTTAMFVLSLSLAFLTPKTLSSIANNT